MEFKWDQSLATGNNVIDWQHQELFRRLEKLVEVAKHGGEKDAIPEVIAFLESYVIKHFDAEEQIQIVNSYPDYDSHKRQHHEFLDTIRKLRGEFEREGSNVSMLVKSISTIGNWISDHIRQSDRALAGYLRGRAKAGTLRETVGSK